MRSVDVRMFKVFRQAALYRCAEWKNIAFRRENIYYNFYGIEDIGKLSLAFPAIARKFKRPSQEHEFFWCAYIEWLIESGMEESAWRIMQDLLKEGWGVSACAKYLRLSAFAKDHECSDLSICETSKIASHVFTTNSSGLFDSLVANAESIALVGNAPYDNGKGLGSEIDAHDLVIRINNYASGEYAFDFGTKTDVWVKATFDDIDHDCRRWPRKVILYADEYSRKPVPRSYLKAILEEMESLPVGCFRPEFRSGLVKRYGISPTTGFSLIHYLWQMKCKKLDVYGFSFVDRGTHKQYLSYAGTMQNAAAHDMDIEAYLLLRLPWKGRSLNAADR